MTDLPRRKGAVLIELDPPDGNGAASDNPASAPPVPEVQAVPEPSGRAMQSLAVLAARPQRGLVGWLLGTFFALVGFGLSVLAYDFVTNLIASRPILGWIGLGLLGAFLLACLAVIVRELAALSRLRRIDGLRDAAARATDLPAARKVTDRLARFYAGRDDTRWGRDELAKRRDDVFDADAILGLAETSLLAPLDAAAAREVEAAARQVALVTAVVPLALADVVAALTSNLRMIRRIALIYGGRGGTLGSWRLARTVLTHLAATGAVAVGDDLIQSVAGGGLLSKLSRRFGEGVVNGALTARVGVAAMEVCRPLPFTAEAPPRISALVGRSMTGLFDRKDS